jgi:hypothetical protein
MPDTEMQDSTGIDLPPRPGEAGFPVDADSEPGPLVETGVDLPSRPPTEGELYPIETDDIPGVTGIDLPPRPPPGNHVQFIPIETDELPDDEGETETYQQQHLLEADLDDMDDLDEPRDHDEETEQMDHPPWMNSGELTSPDLPRRIPGPKIDTGYFTEGQRPRPPAPPDEDDVELPPPPVPPPSLPGPPRAPTLPWGSEELSSDSAEDDGLATLPTVTEEAPSLPSPGMHRRTSRVQDLHRAISEVIEGDSGAEGPTGNYPEVAPLPPMPPPSGRGGVIVPPPPPDDRLPSGGVIVPPPPPDSLAMGATLPPPPGPLIPPPPVGAMMPLDDQEPETESAAPGRPALGPIHLGDSGIMVVVPNTPIHEVRAGQDERPQMPAPVAGADGKLNELAPISRPPPRSVPVGLGNARKPGQKPPTPTWLIYTLIGVAAFAVLVVAGIVVAVKLLGK